MKVDLAEEYVAEQVRSDRFADANKVVADALRFAIAREEKQRFESLPIPPMAETKENDRLKAD